MISFSKKFESMRTVEYGRWKKLQKEKKKEHKPNVRSTSQKDGRAQDNFL